MAYAAPDVYTVGEILTSTSMNKISADISWIGGPDGRSTTFPSSPVDGQVFDYIADATNGVIWRFKYNSGEATYKWEFDGGSPLFAEVVTSETTTSSTYAALATAGPSITVPRAGDYRVEIGCSVQANGNLTESVHMSYDIGATGAVDADALYGAVSGGGTVGGFAGSRMRVKTGLAASTALVSKYKADSSGSAAFANRWMAVSPVRVI